MGASVANCVPSGENLILPIPLFPKRALAPFGSDHCDMLFVFCIIIIVSEWICLVPCLLVIIHAQDCGILVG